MRESLPIAAQVLSLTAIAAPFWGVATKLEQHQCFLFLLFGKPWLSRNLVKLIQSSHLDISYCWFPPIACDYLEKHTQRHWLQPEGTCNRHGQSLEAEEEPIGKRRNKGLPSCSCQSRGRENKIQEAKLLLSQGKTREGMMAVQISFTWRVIVADTRKEEGRNELTMNCRTCVSPFVWPSTNRVRSKWDEGRRAA